MNIFKAINKSAFMRVYILNSIIRVIVKFEIRSGGNCGVGYSYIFSAHSKNTPDYCAEYGLINNDSPYVWYEFHSD
jgi:hypothetical protein